MKVILAILAAGVVALPGVAGETPAQDKPYVDAAALCRDGDVVGVQIRTNVTTVVKISWPANVCAASST